MIPLTSCLIVISILLQRMIMPASLPATHTQRPYCPVYLGGTLRSSASTNSIVSLRCCSALIHLFTGKACFRTAGSPALTTIRTLCKEFRSQSAECYSGAFTCMCACTVYIEFIHGFLRLLQRGLCVIHCGEYHSKFCRNTIVDFKGFTRPKITAALPLRGY